MSIQKTGPENYRYQDRIAVWLALINFGKDKLEVWNDQKGVNEDITLRYQENGIPFALEVQSKGHTEFSLKLLAECLIHFGDRQSHICLFDKLIEGTKIIITTKGRCDDSIKSFILHHEDILQRKKQNSINRKTFQALIEAIKEKCSSDQQDTPLKQTRKSHCLALISSDPKHLLQALSKLSIVELFRERDVIEKSKAILIDKHAVPYALAKQAVDELKDEARTAVEKQWNLFPRLKAIVEKYSQKRHGMEGYIYRGQEKEWLNELMQDNMLLLSGVPRCGKSATGRHLLDLMAHEGYEVFATDDVRSASEFLSKSSAQRCVILEDPFGNRGVATNDIARKLLDIKRLCGSTNAGQKLIVCQSQEELMRAFDQSNLRLCRISKHDWHDLSLRSSNFLQEIWSALKISNSIPDNIFTPMDEALTQNATIQPGALEYLAFNYDQVPKPYTKEALITFARQEPNELSTILYEQFDQEAVVLLGVLAFALFSASSITSKDLAFILSPAIDGEAIPGFKKSIGQAYSLGDFGPGSTLDYSEEYQLPEKYEELLEIFAQRHILIGEHNQISFRHSFYQATGELLLKKASKKTMCLILQHCERSLGCSSPQIAISTAKGISILEKIIKNSYKDQLTELAFKTRLSVYPAAYHCVISFIFENMNFLNAEQRNNFLNHPEGIQASLYEFEWKNGEAWIPENISFLKTLSQLPEFFSIEWLNKQVTDLNTPSSPPPTPEVAAVMLKYYDENPGDLSLSSAMNFMNYDLASIRSETAKTWLQIDHKEDDKLLEKIIKDPVPSIVSAAYTSIAQSWEDLPSNRRSQLLECLIEATTNQFNTAVLFGKLVNFCEYGNNYPWELFLSLMPIVLAGDNQLRVLNTARFHYVIKEAVKNNEIESLRPLLASWLSRIEKWIEIDCFDEFQIAIVPLLISSTNSDPSLRWEYSQKLLQQSNTPAAMVFLGDYIDKWETITQDEQKNILDLLHSKRNDLHWLQAAALTRHHVPSQIQKEILGQPDFLSTQPSELIEKMDKRLFENCVHIYCGSPQPLWYYGLHHKNPSIWAPILFEIAKDASNPLFQTALSEFIFQGKENLICELVVANAGRENLFFEVLLRETMVIHRLPNIPNVWSALIDAAPDQEIQKKWFEQIASVFLKLSGGLPEAKYIFNKSEQLTMLSEYLKNDLICTQIVRDYAKHISVSDGGKNLLNAARVFAALKPQLHKTISEMTDLLKLHGFDETDEHTELEAMRKERIDAKFSQETTSPEEYIKDWTIPLH